MVSTGDRVYITLGYRAAVSVLDATTGEIVAVYDQTKNADEIVLHDGILLARCSKTVPDYPQGATAWNVTVRWKKATDPAELPPALIGDETLIAVDTKTGKAVWENPEKRIVTLSLAALDGKVCYHTFEELVCLDLATGSELWRRKSEPWPDLTGTGITLVMYQGVVFVTSSEGLVARSVDNGEELWRGPRIPRVAPRQPADLLIADGLVWTSLTPEMPMGTVPKQRSDTARITGTTVQGLDPRTGEVRKTVDIGQLMSVGHHVRCYRSKGTHRYLLWPKRGIEFVDIASGTEHMRCDWTRGECSYGVMPANGLLYVPPHPCVCFTGVALNGFNAFAAGRPKVSGFSVQVSEGERLTKGPAYGQIGNGKSKIEDPDPWPTYRHDPSRSGSTTSIVAPNVQPRWAAEIGGRLTQPVVANEKVFVVSVDEHTVYCLDEKEGRRVWTFTAGGRIDSPPSLHNGLVLFGCRDGRVYCLRAADGELAWRFQAAPKERRIVAFGQVESAWGVHGSVLVVNDTAYLAAGRSSFVDGGIYLYGLETATGKVLHRAHVDGPWPDIRKDQGQPYHMEGAKTDVLVSDGTHLFMFHNKFDLKLDQVQTTARGAGGDRVTGLHLTATSGLLDDTLHDRFYWFHNQLWPGSHFACRGPKSGHILVFDEKTTYGQRAFSKRERLSPKFTPGREGYLLFADHGDTEPLVPGRSGRGTEYRPSKPPIWSAHVPVRALAMVLTKDVLFLAGPPDVVPQEDPYAAFEGRAGARLWAVSKEDGTRLAEYELDSPPVFDGMSAAGRRLYIATQAGNVLCIGE
jgi:outer membrane protein assembly factor BamB